MSTKSTSILVLLSFAFAVTLGLLDRESTSFLSLFQEAGNWVGLAIYSTLFFFCGVVTIKLYNAVRRTDG